MAPEWIQLSWDELRRRHVVRVAIAYLIAGLAVIEGVDLLLAAIDVPSWTYRMIVVLVLVGFPIALGLAWAFDITDEGVVRDHRPEAGPKTAPTADAESGARATGIDMAGAEPAPRSRIAVLPFASIHADRDHDYFADGMTEELISVLARIQGLDVIARTSVARYKDSQAGIAEIARALRVGSVLEGSVRKAGDQLRVTVQLIDAGTEGHLWAEDYDRELREIFHVQADIAAQVAEALELRLLAHDREEIEQPPTRDLEAYDLYLLGRHQLNRRSDESLHKAISHFEAALGKDPEFAQALAGLSDAYLLGGIGYMAEPPQDALRRARAYARRALAIDDRIAEAHTSEAYASILSWDFEGAEASFRRAIELNPSHAQAHQWYAHFLAASSARYEEAIESFERALELDPLSAVLTTELGWPYGYMGQHERALVQYRRALEMDPDLPIAHYNVGWALQRLGRLDAAIEAYERALALQGGGYFIRGFLATAQAEAGREEVARRMRQEFVDELEAGAPVAMYIGLIDASLGDHEAAFEWLHRAVDDKEPLANALAAGGDFFAPAELRADPRFGELRRRIEEVTGIELQET